MLQLLPQVERRLAERCKQLAVATNYDSELFMGQCAWEGGGSSRLVADFSWLSALLQALRPGLLVLVKAVSAHGFCFFKPRGPALKFCLLAFLGRTIQLDPVAQSHSPHQEPPHRPLQAAPMTAWRRTCSSWVQQRTAAERRSRGGGC